MSTSSSGSLPLRGIRVLELGRLYSAPWACQMLGDFGAEVIKVEMPGIGDPMRAYGPGFIPDAEGNPTADSVKFSSSNRNKKSVTINLGSARGQEMVRALSRDCDVFVENFKVGDLKRKGLDYESVRALRPDIVYASITGFGQTGPYRDIGTIDPMIQAYSGFMSVNGEADGPPVKAMLNVMDLTTGMYAAFAILLALRARDAGAGGSHIDLSMLDCGVALMSSLMLPSLAWGRQLPRTGSAAMNWVPSGVFTCTDGLLYLAVGSDQDFAAFTSIIGQAELAKDVRYSTRASRDAHESALRAIASEALAGQGIAHWVPRLQGAGLIAAPVLEFADVLGDVQVRARGLVQQVRHALGAEIHQVRNPIRMSGWEEQPLAPPPTLGQHTREILQARLGLGPEEIDALQQQHVL